jgi:hypothetical protein
VYLVVGVQFQSGLNPIDCVLDALSLLSAPCASDTSIKSSLVRSTILQYSFEPHHSAVQHTNTHSNKPLILRPRAAIIALLLSPPSSICIHQLPQLSPQPSDTRGASLSSSVTRHFLHAPSSSFFFFSSPSPHTNGPFLARLTLKEKTPIITYQ